MTPSWRKPVGALAILAIIALWCALIASAAETIGRLPWPAELAIYVAAGVIWILPLKPALRWMETGRWRARG